MGDQVYRVIYRFADCRNNFECYATQKEAVDAWNFCHADGVVNWELPDGVHLYDSMDVSGKPWLKVYTPPAVECWYNEKYVFDDEDAFWQFVFYRWPHKLQWRVSKQDRQYVLKGRSNEYRVWQVVAFVDNIKDKTNAYNGAASGMRLGEEYE